jgi:hypothetical protein
MTKQTAADVYAMASDTWVLVRPDGYVGAIVASDQLETLERYLQKVGLGTEGGARA